MTDWLRTHTAHLLARPIHDDRRPILLTAITLIVTGAAITLITAPPAPEPKRRTPARQPPAAAPAPTSAPSPAPDEDPAPATSSEEGAADPTRVTRGNIAAAKRAARRFLRVYLAYTYGRARAAQLPAATAHLRRTLAAAPPRVPAGERRRRPRITALQANGASAGRISLIALIDDGPRAYTVALQMTRAAGRWLVTDLGAA